jgi:hypothetical protein
LTNRLRFRHALGAPPRGTLPRLGALSKPNGHSPERGILLLTQLGPIETMPLLCPSHSNYIACSRSGRRRARHAPGRPPSMKRRSVAVKQPKGVLTAQRGFPGNGPVVDQALPPTSRSSSDLSTKTPEKGLPKLRNRGGSQLGCRTHPWRSRGMADVS